MRDRNDVKYMRSNLFHVLWIVGWTKMQDKNDALLIFCNEYTQLNMNTLMEIYFSFIYNIKKIENKNILT